MDGIHWHYLILRSVQVCRRHLVKMAPCI